MTMSLKISKRAKNKSKKYQNHHLFQQKLLKASDEKRNKKTFIWILTATFDKNLKKVIKATQVFSIHFSFLASQIIYLSKKRQFRESNEIFMLITTKMNLSFKPPRCRKSFVSLKSFAVISVLRLF